MYDVDVNAIEKWFETHYGKELAVNIDEEEQYNCLIDSLIDAGHLDDEYPIEFQTMASNSDVVNHGGKIAVSFYLNEYDEIRWSGFCWRGYFERYSNYIVVPFEEFIICSDFEFNQDEDLSVLFGGAL